MIYRVSWSPIWLYPIHVFDGSKLLDEESISVLNARAASMDRENSELLFLVADCIPDE